MGYIEDLIKSTLGVIYDNEDVSELAGEDKEYGGEDAAAANRIGGQTLDSILSKLNETNSGGGDDPSGSAEYKAAYKAVEEANYSFKYLKNTITDDSYNKEDAMSDINRLRGFQTTIGEYLAAKSKGVFFKHPITPKGKKRYACMQNAFHIVDAVIMHYDGIDTRHDNDAIDYKAATANQQGQSSFDVTAQNDNLKKGLDNPEVVHEVIKVASYMGETFFNLDKLTAFLTMYKSNALEIPVKALLMRENTPAANSTIASAFKLGGPDLSNQLKLAYKLLREVDKLADELWKNVEPNNQGGNTSAPDAQALRDSKKDILKYIRELNIYREINAKGLKRL